MAEPIETTRSALALASPAAIVEDEMAFFRRGAAAVGQKV